MRGPIPMVEADVQEFGPTAAGFVMLITYVVIITNTMGPDFAGPNGTIPDSLHTLARLTDMKLVVDGSLNPCTDFAGYSCGKYTSVHGIGPWHDAGLIALSRLKETPQYERCDNFVQFTNVTAHAEEYSTELRLRTLLDGFAVNGIVLRVDSYNGVYRMYLLDTNNTSVTIDQPWEVSRCDCLNAEAAQLARGVFGEDDDTATSGRGPLFSSAFYEDGHFIVFQDTTCDKLCLTTGDTYDVTVPCDFPEDCVDTIGMFSKEALAYSRLDHHIVLSRAMRFLEALGLHDELRVYVGGGRGAVSDIPLAGEVLDMWLMKKTLEIDLIGTDVKRDAWPANFYTVNAMYVEEQDAVFVYDGLLVPPFYSADYTEELLWGGIDFILAHEIGHAIDHRRNDTKLGKAIIDHLILATHQAPENVSITVHEDLADLYGMQILDNTTEMTNISYIQYAQMWCGGRPDFSGDTHAPGAWRVNWTLQQSLPWTELYC